MPTMNESKMKVSIRPLLCIFLVMGWVLLPVTLAGAVTANWTITSYVTKMEAVPVVDVEGHVVGVYERRGVAVFETGETAAYLTRGTFDVIKGQGPFQGYTQLTFEDGATAMVKYQGELRTPSGNKLPVISGKGEYIKGTGRLEGITGSVSFSGKYITPFSEETKGDIVVDATGTYTLPSK